MVAPLGGKDSRHDHPCGCSGRVRRRTRRSVERRERSESPW
uniref:Uncharacterized protein n=1 Tax=uncultured bacterium A1Q1_fos_515 TaxID=1256581 RepID=L7VVI9_9BACT|nr:hypothetical protein [uncultured bacterium A1Q1_fos_515]